jgi:hypothetical protein
MNDNTGKPNQAAAIRKVLSQDPTLKAKQVATMLGCRVDYVRAVKHRDRPRDKVRPLKSALFAATQAYAAAVELRRLHETDPENRDLYLRYCDAWETHRSAERVYLRLFREPLERTGNVRPIRGVPVRDLVKRLNLVPIAGKIE